MLVYYAQLLYIHCRQEKPSWPVESAVEADRPIHAILPHELLQAQSAVEIA